MNITGTRSTWNRQNRQLRAFADNLNISVRRDLTGLSSVITPSTSTHAPDTTVTTGSDAVGTTQLADTTAANGTWYRYNTNRYN